MHGSFKSPNSAVLEESLFEDLVGFVDVSPSSNLFGANRTSTSRALVMRITPCFHHVCIPLHLVYILFTSFLCLTYASLDPQLASTGLTGHPPKRNLALSAEQIAGSMSLVDLPMRDILDVFDTVNTGILSYDGADSPLSADTMKVEFDLKSICPSLVEGILLSAPNRASILLTWYRVLLFPPAFPYQTRFVSVCIRVLSMCLCVCVCVCVCLSVFVRVAGARLARGVD